MRQCIYFFICLQFFINAAAQSDDNIVFVRAQKEIGNGNYETALAHLKKASVEGKRSDFYLSFRATCYENLYKYDSAVIMYKMLYKKNNSMDVLKKIADIEEYAENKAYYLKAVDS